MKNTSKWKENLTIIISYAITIITSIFIPELLISLFDLSIDVKILGLIFSVLILIIFILTRHIINKKQPNENSDEEKAKNILASHQIENFKLYAISSAYWQDVLNSIENINIKNCTILIRKNDSLNSEIYENEVARTIEKWKVLRIQGKIHSLKIIAYNHIPDHYFALFDKTVIVTGFNNFDETDSTQQYGSRNAHYIFNDDAENDKIIEAFDEHFENYVLQYKNNLVYDSNNA